MRKFVLFSMTRTGSTMFSANISSHASVKCHGAYFGSWFPHDKPGSLASRLPQWASRERRCANIEAFLRDLYALSDRFDYVGFKHHISADQGVTRHALSDPDFARFHIVRPNHLATYSSGKMAVRTRERRERGVDKVKRTAKFKAREFEDHVARRERFVQLWKPRFDAAGVIEIPYSEARTPEGVEKVWRALGIEDAYTSEERTVKRNSDSMLDRFSNPDAVHDWVVKNGRLDWLEER